MKKYIINYVKAVFERHQEEGARMLRQAQKKSA